jgi:predicted metal-dependent hydrolase
MNLEVPAAEEFNPLYIAGNATVSYLHTALGLYVVYLEPFIVKSLRKVMPLIRDEALKDEVDRFCRQESQHYQQHADFNKLVLARSYPGLEERLNRVRDDFDGYLRDRSDRFRVGFVEGFESYTSQNALALLKSGLYEHKRSEPRFARLFKWHLIEEIEHRNVAFDVYQHLYGNYLVRAGMCWAAQRHLFSFYADCMRIMSAAEGERGGARYRTTFKHRLLFTRVDPFAKRLRSMLPGYTPHHYKVPADVAALADQLTAQAASVQ